MSFESSSYNDQFQYVLLQILTQLSIYLRHVSYWGYKASVEYPQVVSLVITLLGLFITFFLIKKLVQLIINTTVFVLKLWIAIALVFLVYKMFDRGTLFFTEDLNYFYHNLEISQNWSGSIRSTNRLLIKVINQARFLLKLLLSTYLKDNEFLTFFRD
ncbi:BA75_03173T0 [Komagataella pastoris]|uniref:BA75_03173T0 n=1 Tax=Komagataella pastoris TaxID=4922 RepID=A0A1B2JB97_PICPA|nr:BA75_03173T0 [Komagataella pastoris]